MPVSILILCWSVLLTYHNDPNFSDRQAWESSVDPNQTVPEGAIHLHPLDSFLFFKTTSLNFRIITTFFLMSEFFGFLWYVYEGKGRVWLEQFQSHFRSVCMAEGLAILTSNHGSWVRTLLELRFFPNLNDISLHRACHVYLSIILI